MTTRQPFNLTSHASSSSPPMDEDMAPFQNLHKTSNESSTGSAPAAPTAPAKTPLMTPFKSPGGLNADNCFRFLKEADKQVSSNRTLDEKNRRNTFWLAMGALGLNTMMKAKERRGIKG